MLSLEGGAYIMKLESRGVRGKKLMQKPRSETSASMKEFPWKNPLTGGVGNIAMAEVAIKGAGLSVGFKVRF